LVGPPVKDVVAEAETLSYASAGTLAAELLMVALLARKLVHLEGAQEHLLGFVLAVERRGLRALEHSLGCGHALRVDATCGSDFGWMLSDRGS
jgi:hypothetical protein